MLYLQDQLEADDNLTMEQRLALAGGSALEGVGDAVGSDAIGIAGHSLCSLTQHITLMLLVNMKPQWD